MKKSSYTYDELINCGNGGLFGPGNAKLPLPPMLMFDRITKIKDNEGIFNKGIVEAELDIKDNLKFAQTSGDYNKIHIDEKFAKKFFFKYICYL